MAKIGHTNLTTGTTRRMPYSSDWITFTKDSGAEACDAKRILSTWTRNTATAHKPGSRGPGSNHHGSKDSGLTLETEYRCAGRGCLPVMHFGIGERGPRTVTESLGPHHAAMCSGRAADSTDRTAQGASPRSPPICQVSQTGEAALRPENKTGYTFPE